VGLAALAVGRVVDRGAAGAVDFHDVSGLVSPAMLLDRSACAISVWGANVHIVHIAEGRERCSRPRQLRR
jgi:hypothetical protein